MSGLTIELTPWIWPSAMSSDITLTSLPSPSKNSAPGCPLTSSRREEINGQPGALLLDREGRLISVMILDVAEGEIQGVSSIVNPDKLRHLGPLADVGALLRERR